MTAGRGASSSFILEESGPGGRPGAGGGADEDFDPGFGRLGIEHWAEAGIVGRGVLVDLPQYCTTIQRDYDPFSGEAVGPDLIRDALEAQGSVFRPGDVLCINFGWAAEYFGLPEDEQPLSAGRKTFAGLAGSEEVAEFLWNSRVAALVCDNPAIEVSPGDPSVGSLHRRAIPLLGLAFGELFDLRRLAQVCRDRGRWDFLFVSVPVNVPGAIGSPGNAVAVV